MLVFVVINFIVFDYYGMSLDKVTMFLVLIGG